MYDDDEFYLMQQQNAQLQQAVGLLMQREQAREITNHVRNSEQGFHAKNDKYYDALNHMRSQLVENMTGLGYTDDQAQQQIHAWEANAAMQALQNGQDPAATIYSVATERYGYNPEPQTYDNPEEGPDDFHEVFNEAFRETGLQVDSSHTPPESAPTSTENSHLDTIVD